MAALANPAFLYVGSDVYTAVTAWAALAVDAAGRLIRPLTAPAVGNERVYVATTAGTTGAAEPTWTFTKGAIQPTDGTVVWQECTGQPAVNGDVTNTKDWNSAKSNTVALGQIIKNIAGTYYFICTVAGTSGSGAEPSWTLTAGVTTADNTVTWCCIGTVGSFAAFAAPHANILNADAATWQTVAGGNNIYISSAHAETRATSLTLAAGQATASAPNKYLVVPNNVAPPAAGSVTTGATVSTTGANAITVGKYGTYTGLSFLSGSSITIGAGTPVFENCNIQLNNATSNNQIGCTASRAILKNCTIVFGHVGQSIGGNSQPENFVMLGGSIAATGSIPTTPLFPGTAGSTRQANMILRGVDLSKITTTLLNASELIVPSDITLMNCKLGAAVAMVTGAVPSADYGVLRFRLHNCDSGSKNYRFYENDLFMGTIQQETTIINNAGATDGTQRISWNIATTAKPSFALPYITELLPISFWNESTGSSLTATIEIAGANQLTNADIWMELEYPGSASFPLSSLLDNRVADALTTGTNVTSSAASWGGSPAFTQKLEITFTPLMKGFIRARIYVAKPSITVYVDPKLSISGVTSPRQYLSPGQGYINESASAGAAGMLFIPSLEGV